MKLNKLLIVGCLSIAAISIASCKKTSTKSTKDMLQGTWTLSQAGYDANNNNTVDPGETTDTTGGTVAFNSDNTGSLSGLGLSFPFTYTVSDKNLSVVTFGDTIKFNITVSDHNLTMKELDDSTFTVWTK